jgi:acetyl esterase
MKTLLKTLKYIGLGLFGMITILVIYLYSRTFTPNGRMLWQQAAYAQLFHKVLKIQPSQIGGIIEKELKNMKSTEILPEVGSFETIKITADSLSLHVYKPKNLQPDAQVVIYYHGGGFNFPYMPDAHVNARKYANAFGAVVVGVDYRVTPKYSFPVPINDCYNTFKWVLENAKRLGGNPNKVVVIGESAGGNISAVVAQKAMKEGYKNIVHQVLICPTTDPAHMYDYPSFKKLQEGYILNKTVIDFFFNAYFPNNSDKLKSDASPLLSNDLAGLPLAFIITAQFDPIKDEGLAYYEKLKKSGVKAKFKEMKGVMHCAQGPLMGDYIDGLNQEIAVELKK